VISRSPPTETGGINTKIVADLTNDVHAQVA
jgi:hypothetical protein